MSGLSRIDEKRQRIQQLRQRRLARESDDTTEPIETTPGVEDSIQLSLQSNLPPTIDVAVQTTPSGSTANTHFSEITQFDKAIQTDSEPLIEQDVADIDQSIQEMLPLDTKFNESELNQFLEEAIIELHEFIEQTNSSRKDKVANDSTDVPIVSIAEIKPLKSRIPKSIEVASQENLLLINFDDKDQPLAVVFKLTGKNLVPVHFLTCLSSISIIKFDFFSNNKIIAGLKNGRVAVWDLNDSFQNDAIKLPTLISPPDLSNESLHTSAITSLLQFNSEPNLFITTCNEGKINLWSTNFLEYPRGNTFVLENPVDNDSIGLLNESFKTITHALIVEDLRLSLKDLNFLDSLIVGTDTGEIHRLANEPKIGYINTTIQSKIIGSMTTIGYKREQPVLAVTCFDSNIHMFNPTAAVAKLTTNYMILGVAKRYRREFQFVTFGLFDELNDDKLTLIDFWDLNKDLRTPTFSIKIHLEHHPVLASFSSDGEHLYVGFSDGKLFCYNIDDLKFKQQEQDTETIHDIL